MVFTVELIQGRDGRLAVDESGNIVNPDGFASCFLGRIRWEQILEAGKQYGWVPQGTIPDDAIDTDNQARGDYTTSSQGSKLYKVFAQDDALNLAKALEKYIKADKNQQGTDGSDLVDTIVYFLKYGGFVIVWDD